MQNCKSLYSLFSSYIFFLLIFPSYSDHFLLKTFWNFLKFFRKYVISVEYDISMCELQSWARTYFFFFLPIKNECYRGTCTMLDQTKMVHHNLVPFEEIAKVSKSTLKRRSILEKTLLQVLLEKFHHGKRFFLHVSWSKRLTGNFENGVRTPQRFAVTFIFWIQSHCIYRFIDY